ncbi:uncharacterized protein LOC129285806 [Prosopis cineraria]|uniref:uncharacterized protein LOC129285806 n=1 Tax=Prosopis cineraria TaxID=364024 RepID=UPI00240EFEAC|nr:uncharacterized protein LOC129285806 [Prosopis cineraria]
MATSLFVWVAIIGGLSLFFCHCCEFFPCLTVVPLSLSLFQSFRLHCSKCLLLSCSCAVGLSKSRGRVESPHQTLALPLIDLRTLLLNQWLRRCSCGSLSSVAYRCSFATAANSSPVSQSFLCLCHCFKYAESLSFSLLLRCVQRLGPSVFTVRSASSFLVRVLLVCLRVFGGGEIGTMVRGEFVNSQNFSPSVFTVRSASSFLVRVLLVCLRVFGGGEIGTMVRGEFVNSQNFRFVS